MILRRFSAITQLQTVGARSVFPCIDEPSYKATFSLSIDHPKGTKATSNMLELETPQQKFFESPIAIAREDFILTKFEPTPRMSTYLLALFVTDFDYETAVTRNGTLLRVWTSPKRQALRAKSLVKAARTLELLNSIFEPLYPLKKMSM